jgi:hypothetical protein
MLPVDSGLVRVTIVVDGVPGSQFAAGQVEADAMLERALGIAVAEATSGGSSDTTGATVSAQLLADLAALGDTGAGGGRYRHQRAEGDATNPDVFMCVGKFLEFARFFPATVGSSVPVSCKCGTDCYKCERYSARV